MGLTIPAAFCRTPIWRIKSEYIATPFPARLWFRHGPHCFTLEARIRSCWARPRSFYLSRPQDHGNGFRGNPNRGLPGWRFAARGPDGDLWAALFRPDQPVVFGLSLANGGGRSVRAGGRARRLRSPCRGSGRRGAEAVALGTMPEHRPSPARHGPAATGRRIRLDRPGSERYSAGNHPPCSAQRLVPFPARGGRFADGSDASRAGIERQDVRVAGSATGRWTSALVHDAGAGHLLCAYFPVSRRRACSTVSRLAPRCSALACNRPAEMPCSTVDPREFLPAKRYGVISAACPLD